jgi:hypothetical protein
MGLDEVEAVDYVLMLSRDEAMQEANRWSTTMSYHSAGVEEGVFEGDFDKVPASTPFASSSQRAISTSPRTGHSRHSIFPQEQQQTSRSPTSSSNQKVQVSPQNKMTPMQARFGIGRAVALPPLARSPGESRFPPISASTSPTPSRVSTGLDVARLSDASGSAGSASPHSVQSAWSTPLARSAANRPSASSTQHTSRPGASPPARRSDARTPPSGVSRTLDDMDADMRYAIELSLAEARSRGEGV